MTFAYQSENGDPVSFPFWFVKVNICCAHINVVYFILDVKSIQWCIQYTKGTPPGEKMFSFGHCPEKGGEAPARIKKKHNIYVELQDQWNGPYFFS